MDARLDADSIDDDCPTIDPALTENELAHTVRPVLTLVAHPDLNRLGEIAVLSALAVRRPVVVSRMLTKFGHAPQAHHAPIQDRSVSRAGFELSAYGERGELRLDPRETAVVVAGNRLCSPMLLSPKAIECGVQIKLSSQVALLLHYQPECPSRSEGPLIGVSAPLLRLLKEIEAAAKSTGPVLILGESGSGKELVAQAIHGASTRRQRALVSVNMATLNEALAYSQLFGHQKGAFTGAEQSHVGLFERAHGGSLFLDEIADAPAAVQAMLLRVLETSCVLPLGGRQERRVDARILAATERDIGADVKLERFRASLAQRLMGLVVRVPALRERAQDIPRLLLHFLRTLDPERGAALLGAGAGHDRLHLSADFMLELLSRSFPGNVRELRNVAWRLLAHGYADHARAATEVLAPSPAGVTQVTERVDRSTLAEKEVLRAALANHQWSPARAARALGIPNSTLHYWMKRHALGRRASDVPEAELRDAARIWQSDVHAMASALSVSERGLRLRLSRSPVV